MTDAIRRKRIFRVTPIVAAGLLMAGAAALRGQGDSSPKPASKPESTTSDVPSDLPKYDVATIKPAQGSDMRIAFMFTPDGISLSGVQLQMMLREAFHVEDDHIIGAPGWVKTTRYDVQAKVAPEDAPKLGKLKIDERRSMLLPLLVERFNLKYHHETRELPGYELVVAKGGPKMKMSEIQDSAAPKPGDPGANPKPGEPAPTTGPRRMLRMMGRGQVEAEGSNTQMLARVLSQQLGRTVVDKTGLSSNYDYKLSWTPDDAPPPMAGGAEGGPPKEVTSDSTGPSLLTALQEQLGLKLESTKGMADVIVIDHIDQPSEN
jgi:uncharacterized protein (TIGR03435 family)